MELNRYLLEIFELLVSWESLFLSHSTVDSDSREVLLRQKLSECDAALHRLDEDDHLKQETKHWRPDYKSNDHQQVNILSNT